jgi:hypothetical protein
MLTPRDPLAGPFPARTVSLDANTWRMLRRAFKAFPGEVTFAEIRNWGNRDREVETLRWLCAIGLLELSTPGPAKREAEGSYTITPAGIDAADMGEARVSDEVLKQNRKGVDRDARSTNLARGPRTNTS